MRFCDCLSSPGPLLRPPPGVGDGVEVFRDDLLSARKSIASAHRVMVIMAWNEKRGTAFPESQPRQ
jgi:hypothetical protein